MAEPEAEPATAVAAVSQRPLARPGVCVNGAGSRKTGAAALRGAAQWLHATTDAALARLPPRTEAALRMRAEQARPFAPHALCALAGLLLGRVLGRRAERRRAAREGSVPRRAGGASTAELEERLRRADRDSRRADDQVAQLHAEMRQLEAQLERSRKSGAAVTAAAGKAGAGDAEAAEALREMLTEAAAAYDTLGRVLAAERASGALRLARAAAENELLAEQLGQARATASAMLAALEEAQEAEMNAALMMGKSPISPRARGEQAASPFSAGLGSSSSAAAAAQDAANAALGHFKGIFGI